MSNSTRDARLGDWYEVRVQGHLDPSWGDWFGGMDLVQEADGTTRLAGLVADQAALHGLLVRIRDLGLVLVSVNRLQSARRGRQPGA